jgi:hypothetical protein
MANGKLVWLNFENIDALTTLTKSFDVKSPNNVVSILVDLAQKTNDIQLKQMRVCPTCNKEFEIEENTSRAYKLKDHIRHCDLEDTVCKQICKIQHRVKLGSNDKHKGTTTTKDESSGTNDEKEREMEIQLGYRNGVRITDMDDPNYDHKFFDIDMANIKKKQE